MLSFSALGLTLNPLGMAYRRFGIETLRTPDVAAHHIPGGNLVNHADLVAKVASNADLSKESASQAVEAVAKAISESLNAGEEVRYSGLGIFDISARAARQGRNPQTGEAIAIAASKVARFRAAKSLKDTLNAGGDDKKAAKPAAAKAAPKAAAKPAVKKK